MAKNSFNDDLLRMIAAQLWFQTGMQTARELFGKSYFSLGLAEKTTVDQTVFAHMSGNFQTITSEFLQGQGTQQPMGFPTQTPNPKASD